MQAGFPTLPRSSRAGWGYLMLTWGLVGQGNGAIESRDFLEFEKCATGANVIWTTLFSSRTSLHLNAGVAITGGGTGV